MDRRCHWESLPTQNKKTVIKKAHKAAEGDLEEAKREIKAGLAGLGGATEAVVGARGIVSTSSQTSSSQSGKNGDGFPKKAHLNELPFFENL